MPTLDPGPGLAERFVVLPDGRRVRTVVAGQGAPLVVFESGLGAAASEWVTVQRAVASEVGTLSYDRAGLGGSDEDAQPRTLQRIVSDLALVLDAAGATDPVVLVGHSWGGPILRVFAETLPERVAGLVLVDGSEPETMTANQVRQLKYSMALLSGLSRLGLRRRLIGAMVRKRLGALPPPDRAVVLRDATDERGGRTARREAAGVAAGLLDARRLKEGMLPDRPVTYVVGVVAERGAAAMRRMMLELSEREMAAHPQGRCVRAERSGHLVPQQEPELVADEVLALVARART